MEIYRLCDSGVNISIIHLQSVYVNGIAYESAHSCSSIEIPNTTVIL